MHARRRFNVNIHGGKNGLVASLDGKGAVGTIVWWTLGGKIPHTRFEAALRAVDSKVRAPEAPTRLAALSRACVEVARMHKLESRNVGRGQWALVRDPDLDAADKVLTYGVVARAFFEAGELVVESDDEAMKDAIRAAHAQAKDELSATEVSMWLCEVLEDVHAVSLRDRGGVYFLPATKEETWSKIVEALRQCSQTGVYGVPAMRSTDAIEAIVAALSSEASSQVDAIMAELGAPEDEALGKRGLATRERQLGTLLEKIEHYEKLLGAKLEELTSRANEARIAVVTAATVVESEAAAQ
jgi:hypothetical protein